MTEKTTPHIDDLNKLVDLAQNAARIEFCNITAPDNAAGVPFSIPVAIRPGREPRIEGLAPLFEAWRLYPARKKGTSQAYTLKSFTEIVNRHKLPYSAIFADINWQSPKLTAIFNYHPRQEESDIDVAQAENLDHRAIYTFPLSEEWKIWCGSDSKPMNQADFAAFLEDRIAELAAPMDIEKIELERDFAATLATPAALIQLSRGMQINIESTIKNVTTLQTGEAQIVFEESHRDAAGQALRVPGMFMLSIAPFANGAKIRIPARLRYRAAGGKIMWQFQMYRPDAHISERVQVDIEFVKKATGLPCFEGRPEE
jgi:uncharacterized protein YfdQ (DUF2303 family)